MNDFQPVSETTRLSEKVFFQIREAIASGKYRSGDKLPSENELADAFKVSRTSIREAMKMLAGQGLVSVRRGLGAFVAECGDSSYLKDVQTILSQEKENILELFQIRKILETEAAAWAAQKARPEDLEKMEKLLAESEVLAKDSQYNRQKLNEINSEFHYVLVKAAGNRTLEKVMIGLMDMLTEVRDITLQLPGRHLGSVAGHRQLLAAIRGGDAPRARTCMAKHLKAVEDIIRKMQ
ncbi:MAG: FadR/GntR family transcriptional regulator [Negativicutes bacterium]|nr:FadR/GntR family transcriptional regulator [Negativicutes bacterium]